MSPLDLNVLATLLVGLVGLVCCLAVNVIVCMSVRAAFREAVAAGAPPGEALEALTRVLVVVVNALVAVVNAFGGGGKPPAGPNALTA